MKVYDKVVSYRISSQVIKQCCPQFHFFSHKIMLSTAHKIIRDDFDYILDGKEIEF